MASTQEHDLSQNKKEPFRLFTPADAELVSIDLIERDKDQQNVLLLKCIIMGSIPMRAHLRAEEVRKLFKMLDFRTILFILTLPFRRKSNAK